MTLWNEADYHENLSNPPVDDARNFKQSTTPEV